MATRPEAACRQPGSEVRRSRAASETSPAFSVPSGLSQLDLKEVRQEVVPDTSGFLQTAGGGQGGAILGVLLAKMLRPRICEFWISCGASRSSKSNIYDISVIYRTLPMSGACARYHPADCSTLG